MTATADHCFMHATTDVAHRIASVRATGWRRGLAALGIMLLVAACGGDPTAPSGSAVQFTAVAAGGRHTCALTQAGATYCWGSNEHLQLGTTAATETCTALGFTVSCSGTPLPSAAGRAFTTVVASWGHTCGLSAGAAWCWGLGSGGQLGDGAAGNSDTPRAVAGGHSFTAIATSISGSVTCAVGSDQHTWCWGPVGQPGQLGNGSSGGSSVPVPVAGNVVFSTVSVGEHHACALSVAGDAWCWGNNWYGQLGVGSTGQDGGLAESLAPVQVSSGLTFRSITAGSSFSCALTAAGAAHCWGYGPPLASAVPVPVSGAPPFVALTAGLQHACGLTGAGAAWCWGQNWEGGLGDGTTDPSAAPVQVQGGLLFSALSAGGAHTCGITTGGDLYCWGADLYGALGLGSSGGHQLTPTKVTAPIP